MHNQIHIQSLKNRSCGIFTKVLKPVQFTN